MEKLRCVVERVTYANEENGYTVIKTRAKACWEKCATAHFVTRRIFSPESWTRKNLHPTIDKGSSYVFMNSRQSFTRA
jgi:hypothetical protein